MSRLAKEGCEVGGQSVEQGDQLLAGPVGDHMLVVLLKRAKFALTNFLAQPG